MSKRSKGKNKRRKRKEEPKLPPQSPLTTSQRPSRHGLFLTVLGLVLTLIGLIALVELFPRLSASPPSFTNPENVTAARFTVTNDGYLKLTDVSAACFIWEQRARSGESGWWNLSLVSSPNLRGTLRPTEGFTVPCLNSPAVIPPAVFADLAVIVYYRPWPFTFLKTRRFYRFVSQLNNGNVTWEKQPPTLLEADFEKWENNPIRALRPPSPP